MPATHPIERRFPDGGVSSTNDLSVAPVGYWHS